MKLTYHNDKKFKRDFVKETRWHREQDFYIKGTYENGGKGDSFKGCSVGCSVNSLKRLGRNSIGYGDHAGLSDLLGWPEWLCRLQDTIFEGLPQAEAMTWTERLAAAVPVGKDIEPVKWHFCAFLMRENIERVLSLKIEDKLKEQVVSAIRQVLSVHTNSIESAARSAAESAESAARSAAESAAWSARSAAWSAARSAAWSARSAAQSAAQSAAWSAESAAQSAAQSAAWSAESAARSAAQSAAWSAWSAESAAQSAANTRHSEELLRILKSYK